MMRRFLSLWLPHWHTTLWHKGHPEADPARPLALYGREGQSRKIMAVNQPARDCGVEKGQFLAMARSLVPDLATHPVTPAADARALHRLASWCRCFSPLVAVDPPDGMWIDSTGCAHLFGGEVAMLETIRDKLMAQGHAVRAALADTAGAAHALARFGTKDLLCIPSGSVAAALDTLPVAALRLDDEAQSRLGLLGIGRVSDLRAVPRAALTRRFGKAVLCRLDQALGHQKEALDFDQPATALSVKRHLMEPIGTAESIAQVMDVLCQDIATLLQKRGLGARRVDLLCHRVDDVVQAVRVGTAEPVNEAMRLSRLLQERIETIDPGFGIEVMSLHVGHAQPRSPVTEGAMLPESSTGAGGLLQAGHPPAGESLVVLAERLRNKPGLRAIYHLAETDSPFPEMAQTQGLAPVSSLEGASRRSHWPRPTRLFAPPRAIAAPELTDHDAPQGFVWQGQKLRVCGADGPERLHGAWWQHPAQAGAIRDYWIVETEQGDRFWLFRRGDGQHPWSGDGAWFVHGLF
ncbi:DUF6504 family protein [Asaia bogorensis]|uniref:DUF6504 family protein n=1 Tax=Asaia bogorensis TaxID=91915 RepID=UPI00286ACB57|nr:DUF6504 family protein [Asaia bogorensis]